MSRQAGSAPIPLIGRIRIAARVTAMLVLLVACVPLYYLWRPLGPHNPWPRLFLRGVTRIIGVMPRVCGQPPRGGTILLSNHVTWIDIPALAGATGTAFVAHEGLTNVPLVHWLCRLNDTVFVARHDRTGVARQIAQVREAIRDTGALTIFPEGTTNGGVDLLAFKSSLLSALDPAPEGISVQPVWLDYGSEGESIAWVGDEPGLANFMRILARARPLRLTVHFLEPLAGADLAGRKAIATAARAAIMRAMSGARSG